VALPEANSMVFITRLAKDVAEHSHDSCFHQRICMHGLLCYWNEKQSDAVILVSPKSILYVRIKS